MQTILTRDEEWRVEECVQQYCKWKSLMSTNPQEAATELILGLARMMQSSLGVDQLRILQQCTKGKNVIVELGVHTGGTTMFLALANPRAKIVAVDVAVPTHGSIFPANVFIYTGRTVDAAQYESSVGFVFVDAEHSKQAVTADIMAWAPKIEADGYIAFHEYSNDCVKEAISEALPNEFGIKWDPVYYDYGHGRDLAVYQRR